MPRQPKRGHFSRSRSLEKFNKRFGQNSLQNIIDAALEKNTHVRILEIGCGEGRVLMELAKLYPTAELVGINKQPWPSMKGRQSIIRTGIYYNIFSRKEILKANLPKIVFTDAKKLPFPAQHFDLIYSQVAIHYIERKDLFLEECWRVLKKDGYGLLHMDTYSKDYPDFMQSESPRFVIYDAHNRPIAFPDYISRYRKKGFDIEFKAKKIVGDNRDRTCLIMHKNTNNKFKLGLNYDQASSFNLFLLNKEKHNTDIFWGYRSVYRTV